MVKKYICGIIPDHILENVAKNAGGKAAKDAAQTLVVSQALRKQRLIPVPKTETDADIAVYDAKNGTGLPGELEWEDEDINDPHEDRAVREAADGLMDTYDLFYDGFQRNSINDEGMKLIATVHYDKDFDNAFWDGNQMVFGDGSFFNPFTRDLTVAAHELTHGVTQYTANLDYFGQSGALNEHISDVFGALTEQYAYGHNALNATWLIGGELVKGKIEGRALRDMLHPGTAYDDPTIGKDPQPDHMDDLYTGLEDNGGVHINSGIPNRAFAIAAIQIGGNAWDEIGAVWYATLIDPALGSSANFQHFAYLTYTHAGELGIEGAVLDGWQEVGINATVDSDSDNPLPIPNSPCVALIGELLEDPDVKALIRKQAVRRLLLQIARGIRKL